MRPRFRFIALGFIPALVAGATGWRAMSLYNDAVEAEAEIGQAWRDSQVAYDDLWKSASESSQVTDAYEDDVRAVIHESGSHARRGSFFDDFFANFGHRDPTLEPSMYRGLQTQAVKGREAYLQSQRHLSALQAAYQVRLERVPDRLLAPALGLPRPLRGSLTPETDLDGDGRLTVLDLPVVTSTRTRGAYAAGRDDALLSAPP